MADRTFFYYIRVGNVLTDPDTAVTLKITSGDTVIQAATPMTRDSTGSYKQVVSGLNTNVVYIAEYTTVLNGTTYKETENFTVDSPVNIQLFTLADLKSALNIANTTSVYDLELSLLVNSVPIIFQGLLNRNLGYGLAVESVFPNDSNDIYIKNKPIDSINSIVKITNNNGTTETTSVNYTTVDRMTGKISVDSFSPGDEIIISSFGGTKVDDSLKAAGIIQAKYMFMRSKTEIIHVNKSMSQQSLNDYKTDTILPIVQQILNLV